MFFRSAAQIGKYTFVALAFSVYQLLLTHAVRCGSCFSLPRG